MGKEPSSSCENGHLQEIAMTIQKLNPYLNFDGHGEKAIKLYQSALGAKVEGEIMRFGGVKDMPVPDEHKGRVMHAMLNVGGGVIMISDTMPGTPYTPGDNVHVCLHFDDVEDMARKFEALSAGGKVTMPLEDTFWGARFGTLTDAYGVCWMFNCEKKKS
jgi:PhnB protein